MKNNLADFITFILLKVIQYGLLIIVIGVLVNQILD
jgi:hypothetical protein